jgi:hypothetical protein
MTSSNILDVVDPNYCQIAAVHNQFLTLDDQDDGPLSSRILGIAGQPSILRQVDALPGTT